MSKMTKHIARNCRLLSSSEKNLQDVYNIIFSHGDTVMAEYQSGLDQVKCTYAQAQAEIEILSKGIGLSLAEEGEYVGLYAENCVEWILLFWAILKSGRKPYLINLRQPVEFTKGILGTLGVRSVVYVKDAPDFGVLNFGFDELKAKGVLGGDCPERPFGNEFALSTNGTTLNEKICVYTGKEVSEQLLNILRMQKRNPMLVGTRKGNIKQLAFLPLYHVFGLEAVYLWYAFWGSTFVFLSEMSPEAILHTVRRNEVTHIFAVPLLWNAVEKNVRRTVASQDIKTQKKFEKGLALSLKLQSVFPKFGRWVASVIFKDVRARLFGESIRFCISGGSAVKESTLELLNGLGYSLNNGYGMTEIGITSVELTRKVRERVKGSIGIPFDSVEYRIGDDSKLLVRGSSLCKYMIINGEKHENIGWFDTGDVMHSDERGAYYISGRISDVVFGDDGENLNPDLAEEVFVLSDIVNYSVLGCQNNSKLMLLVQIAPDMLSLQKKRLLAEIESCNSKLPRSYRVREVRYTHDPIMDERAIKVSRTYLQKAIAEGRVQLYEFSKEDADVSFGESSEIKDILRKLFAQVLSKDESEITDHGHFMNDLGGSSLDYFTLISQIDKRFGVTLGFESQQFGYCINDFERIIKEMIG